MHLFGHELDPTLTEDSVVLPLLLVRLVRLQEDPTNPDIEILNWSSDIYTNRRTCQIPKRRLLSE